MSMFDKKIRKNWSLKVQGTEEQKARYESILDSLKKIDPDISFNIENTLEIQIEGMLSKAEKELEKLKKESEKDTKPLASLS